MAQGPIASDLVANPWLSYDPVTVSTASAKGNDSDELRHFRITDTDLEELVVKLYKQGNKKNKAAYVDLRSILLDAVFEDSIDKTPTFQMVLHDPDWDILNSGALNQTIDVNPGHIAHRWYRLDTYDVNNDEITLTFATRNAIFLSYKKKPYKISRNKVTRAQFILTMLHHVERVKIKMYCPLLKKKQPIAKGTASTRRAKEEGRGKGFSPSDKLTVKGAPANSLQRKTMEEVIEGGEDKNAPGLVIVAAIMTIIQETEAGANTSNPRYIGPFQQDPRYWAATGNAYKDAVGARGKQGFYDAAIPKYKENPNVDLGKFVQMVQGADPSASPLNRNYDKSANRWRAEAQHAVNAYGGIEVEGDGSTVGPPKAYEFMVGPPDGPKNENYLAAMYRLADEVQWRAYWVRDVLHYMPEDELFKAKARARIRRFEDGVESISFSWDRSKRVNQMILSVRMNRWVAPVGTVVVFDEGSADVKGRWLITNIRRSMFDQLGEITLMKPMHRRKEPAHEPGTQRTDPTDKALGAAPDVGDIDGTPKDIIDNVVIPMAINIDPTFKAGGGGSLTPENVAKANAAHSQLTTSGKVSDHKGPYWHAWAADMSTDWVDHQNGIAPMLELAKQLKNAFDLPNYKGDCWPSVSKDKRYRFQICYLTTVGGNHFNHVHFGVKDLRAVQPPNTRRGPLAP